MWQNMDAAHVMSSKFFVSSFIPWIALLLRIILWSPGVSCYVARIRGGYERVGVNDLEKAGGGGGGSGGGVGGGGMTAKAGRKTQVAPAVYVVKADDGERGKGLMREEGGEKRQGDGQKGIKWKEAENGLSEAKGEGESKGSKGEEEETVVLALTEKSTNGGGHTNSAYVKGEY